MTCKELVDLITDYLEGALAQDQRARFESHLGLCAGCRNYLKQMRETLRATGQLTEASLPPETRAKLLKAFRNWKEN